MIPLFPFWRIRLSDTVTASPVGVGNPGKHKRKRIKQQYMARMALLNAKKPKGQQAVFNDDGDEDDELLLMASIF